MRSLFPGLAQVAFCALIGMGLAASIGGGGPATRVASTDASTDGAGLSAVVAYPVHGPDGARLAPGQLDQDHRALLAALEDRLNNLENNRIEPAGLRSSAEDPVAATPDLATFRIARVELGGLPASGGVSTDDPALIRSVSGVAELRDDLGRRLDLVFGGRSRVTATGREIERLGLTTIYLDQPQTELFLVPAELADRRLLASMDDYAAFYREIEGLALDAGPGAQLPRGPAAYFLVVFAKDLLLPGGALAVGLADISRAKLPGHGQSFMRRYPGGWAAAATLATLDLGAGAPLWMTVTLESGQFKVGPEAGPRPIAAFPVTQAARDLRRASAAPPGSD